MYLWGPLSVTTEFSRNCIVKTVRDQEERGEEVSIWLCILSCFRNLTAFWLVSKYLQYRRLIFGPLSSLVSFTLGTGILALRRTKNVAVGAPFHTNNINAFKSQRNRRFYRRQWRGFFFVFFFYMHTDVVEIVNTVWTILPFCGGQEMTVEAPCWLKHTKILGQRGPQCRNVRAGRGSGGGDGSAVALEAS